MEESIGKEFIAAADRLVKGKPYGYVINPGPVETKSPYWGYATDKDDPNCSFVLVKFHDGSGVWIRQYNHFIH